ncbi:MAG: hypothetical protein JO296_21235 [Pseudonocardiales bacterium]|nr:hypothetical protein [Pseudonocardiales bacterium]
MTGEHLRALMARYAPGVAAKELCRRAGEPEHQLAYYLADKNRHNRRPPSVERCETIAKIIGGGCTPGEVYDAIMQDIDPNAVLIPGLSADEQELIANFRKSPPTERVYLRRMAAIFSDS